MDEFGEVSSGGMKEAHDIASDAYLNKRDLSNAPTTRWHQLKPHDHLIEITTNAYGTLLRLEDSTDSLQEKPLEFSPVHLIPGIISGDWSEDPKLPKNYVNIYYPVMDAGGAIKSKVVIATDMNRAIELLRKAGEMEGYGDAMLRQIVREYVSAVQLSKYPEDHTKGIAAGLNTELSKHAIPPPTADRSSNGANHTSQTETHIGDSVKDDLLDKLARVSQTAVGLRAENERLKSAQSGLLDTLDKVSLATEEVRRENEKLKNDQVARNKYLEQVEASRTRLRESNEKLSALVEKMEREKAEASKERDRLKKENDELKEKKPEAKLNSTAFFWRLADKMYRAELNDVQRTQWPGWQAALDGKVDTDITRRFIQSATRTAAMMFHGDQAIVPLPEVLRDINTDIQGRDPERRERQRQSRADQDELRRRQGF